MIDAVLSYHMNPSTCGVSKFNHALAKRLGVPCLSIHGLAGSHSLVSIKTSEMDESWQHYMPMLSDYDLFLHDIPTSGREFLQNPKRIYAANSVIAADLRPYRPDVIEAWCPSTIAGNPTRGTINVLTFGMAHKIQTARYEKLKTLLDGTGEDYTVSVSTAIHEGSPWDETALVADRLRGIFGLRLRVLGYLADDGLARELRDASVVALFFDPALRANNTTAWAVIESGCPLVTNLDADSPMVKGIWSIDRDHWTHFPRCQATGDVESLYPWSWARLTSMLSGVECVR